MALSPTLVPSIRLRVRPALLPQQSEFRLVDGVLEWRYVGQPDSAWAELGDITGPAGADGEDGTDGVIGSDGAPGVVQSIVAGTNVTVDDTDPANPIVSASLSAGNTVIETGNGPFTVADDTAILILNRGTPGASSVVVGSVDDRAGLDLRIFDWAGNAGDITITPDGSEKIMNASSWVLGSSADGKAAFHMIPDTTLNGWLAGA